MITAVFILKLSLADHLRVCLTAEKLKQWYANRRKFFRPLARVSHSPGFRFCSPKIHKKVTPALFATILTEELTNRNMLVK